MNKVFDFSGSAELLQLLIATPEILKQIITETGGARGQVVVYADCDKRSLEGNDLSVRVDEPELTWNEHHEARMDIIGTNGPTGEHYDWIVWNGGDCPVKEETIVDVRFRDGQIRGFRQASLWAWMHCSSPCDIVAFRICMPGDRDAEVVGV